MASSSFQIGPCIGHGIVARPELLNDLYRLLQMSEGPPTLQAIRAKLFRLASAHAQHEPAFAHMVDAKRPAEPSSQVDGVAHR